MVNKDEKSGSGGLKGFWNKQSTGRKAIIGLAAICCVGSIIIIAATSMFSPDKTTTTNTTSPTPTPQTTESGSKTFENDLVKFNYTSNLTVVDNTSGTRLDVHIYDGSTSDPNNEVGTVATSRVNKTSTKNTFNTWQTTTISGYDAIVGKDETYAGAIIFLSDDLGLDVLFDPAYADAANTVVNSFLIKKTPTL